jgi:hypothetical protein
MGNTCKQRQETAQRAKGLGLQDEFHSAAQARPWADGDFDAQKKGVKKETQSITTRVDVK